MKRTCNTVHPMLRLEPATLSAEQSSMGEWWKCPRCDKIAVIPNEQRPERFVRSGTGRHLA